MNNENTNSELHDNFLGAGLEAVLKMLHYVFYILAVIIVGLLIWYFSFGGAFTVEEQEKVLVMNFGKLEDKVYEPGWHWNWPYPISDIVRIPVDRKTIVTTAFWYYADPTKPQNPKEPPRGGPLVPGKDGYLFTGDTNIIHTAWKMLYHVSEPYKYYTKCIGPDDPRNGDPIIYSETKEKLGTRGPDTLIQSIFENAIIEATSKEKVDFALRSPLYIKNIESAVKKAIDNADIGIVVENVLLAGPRVPPLAAIQAFQAVFNASNFSFTEQENARAYAVKMKNEAESESVSLIANAETYRTSVVASIKADTTYFKAMLKEYRKNPDIVLISRYSEVIGEVFNKTEDKFIIRTNKNGKQEIRILLNREPPKKKKTENKE